MRCKVFGANAEMLFQTGDETFRVRLDHSRVEFDVDVSDIELVADVHVEEIVEYV